MTKLLIWEPDEQIARKIQELLKKEAYDLQFMSETEDFAAVPQEAHDHLKALYSGPCAVANLPLQTKAFRTRLAELAGNTAAAGDLQVDEEERVALLDGRRVELTAQEMALLLALMEKPDTPVSREQLLRKAWGYQSIGETRTVDVHVQRLRKKLGCEYIETVYKCGYRLKLA